MKKTIASFLIILSVLILTACQPDQQTIQETQDTTVTQDDETQAPREAVIDSDPEKSAEIDKQVAEDTEKFHELGLDGVITKEDCEQMKDPGFKQNCLEIAELNEL